MNTRRESVARGRDAPISRSLIVISCLLGPLLVYAQIPDFNGVWIGAQGSRVLPAPQPGPRGGGERMRPQLTSEARQIQEDYDLLTDDPGYECSPSSISRSWANPTPIEIEQQDGIVILRYEFMDVVRMVYLDGRNHSGAPSNVVGNSSGRYDGATLVIDSTGFTPSYISTVTGIPQTETLRAAERLTLSEDGQSFQLEITFEDPATFLSPWTTRRTYVRAPDLELLEFGCVLEDAGYEDFPERTP